MIGAAHDTTNGDDHDNNKKNSSNNNNSNKSNNSNNNDDDYGSDNQDYDNNFHSSQPQQHPQMAEAGGLGVVKFETRLRLVSGNQQYRGGGGIWQVRNSERRNVAQQNCTTFCRGI